LHNFYGKTLINKRQAFFKSIQNILDSKKNLAEQNIQKFTNISGRLTKLTTKNFFKQNIKIYESPSFKVPLLDIIITLMRF
jgi:hypothetical protein